MLIQRLTVNGSSINKTDDLNPFAGVMNVIGEKEYIFEYWTAWLRSYVNETPPIPRSAFWIITNDLDSESSISEYQISESQISVIES